MSEERFLRQEVCDQAHGLAGELANNLSPITHKQRLDIIELLITMALRLEAVEQASNGILKPYDL